MQDKLSYQSDWDAMGAVLVEDWSQLPQEPVASVKCKTYNHENFIEDAIRGFLMQETSFPFEIVIHDDASTDRTADIVRQYQEEYPHLIRAVYQSENQRSKGNPLNPILNKMYRGKYIALCEGDDYWIDSYKLQKQVDFLENNPEYVMISHNALKVHEDENYKIAHLVHTYTKPFDFTQRDLMVKNPCVTLTVMFRSGLVSDPPPVIYKSIGGDRRMFLLLTQFGKGRVMPDVVGVYRIHSSSLTSQSKKKFGYIGLAEEQIQNAENWNDYFNGLYTKEFEHVRAEQSKKIVRFSTKNLKLKKALQYSPYIVIDNSMTHKAKAGFYILK